MLYRNLLTGAYHDYIVHLHLLDSHLDFLPFSNNISGFGLQPIGFLMASEAPFGTNFQSALR